MDASTAAAPAKLAVRLPRSDGRPFEPNTEVLKQRLLRKGVFPTPKILHALRKKEIQKAIRRSKKRALESQNPPLSEGQRQIAGEEALFGAISREYRVVKEELRTRNGESPALPVAGKPWERSDGVDLRGLGGTNGEYSGRRLKGEHLDELMEMLRKRNSDDLRWLLDDDLEDLSVVDRAKRFIPNQTSREEDKIRFLVKRLSSKNLTIQDWKFSRLMKLSGLLFTEKNLLMIVDKLGALGNWQQALDVVEWVYHDKDYRHHKSRFVYTKLLAVLGKARKSIEALRIFNMMQEDCQIYPDIAAYHSIAVTLGQAGLVNELINVIECMRQKPSKRLKNMSRRNWDPCLQPDVIIYNAVLNACVPSHQWKGVFWVLEQMRSSGLKPNGATYGLAMEVMLEAGKYDLVHKFFEKMQRSGLALKALTYKVLVRAFWKEGKIDEAIEAVRDMEQRGVVGTAGIYYELACCLCNNGRWKEALLEVEKLKRLPLIKSLEVAFTGMIQSSMDGGHFCDCISIFEHMKDHCAPNIGTINAMLKVYGRNDMFAKAKDLFEDIKRGSGFKACSDSSISLVLDAYSYRTMLETSASAYQWEYFEYLYKEMVLCGYKLDLDKHCWLLVEASRVGKWHLLEHAFDAILEGGDVPHVSLFTEMIRQTVARQHYEHAVRLVNSMAHASMQVSEKQWLDIFSRSGDWISRDKLQLFLGALEDEAAIAEAPVSSLLRSLQSICRQNLSPVASGTIPCTDTETGASASYENDAVVKCRKWNTHCYSPIKTEVINDVVEEHVESFALEQSYGNHSDDANFPLGEQAVVASDFSAGGSNTEKPEKPTSKLPDKLEASATEFALDLLTNHIDFSSSDESPSAAEILEAWRESRKKDGGFSLFQL